MKTNGGGWTVIQRRSNGLTDFFLGWQDYKTGFGNPSGEFWLGNEKIHRLTSNGQNTLHIELEAWNGDTSYANYTSFSVANEVDSYRMNVSGYQGTAGDCLSNASSQDLISNGMQFSARDMDNDLSSDSCANSKHGGWWFKNCSAANLNGKYSGNVIDAQGLVWYSVGNEYRSLKKSQMKVKIGKMSIKYLAISGRMFHSYMRHFV
jgi:hypothetical protein